jgi:dTDP-4-dehydrorhamnose reductase
MAGVGGMLGESFQHVFAPDNELMCTDKDLNASWLSFLDFRNAEEYVRQVQAFKPDYLFHIGAFTSLEYCQSYVDDAYATNTLPVETAVCLANRLNIPVLYISTAGIFDGAQESYDDWDQPNPLGHYARSKYMGERFVVENADRYLVCRAGWMMGGGPTKDKKFIHKLMAQLRAGATELKVVDDKLGTPTYTRDFAAQVKLLISKEYWGVYNMVCQGVTSRLEVAQHLVKALGKDAEVAVNPVGSDYFAKEYFAPRPPSERLLTKKLDLRGINIMRDWRICLDEYLAEQYSDYLA